MHICQAFEPSVCVLLPPESKTSYSVINISSFLPSLDTVLSDKLGQLLFKQNSCYNSEHDRSIADCLTDYPLVNPKEMIHKQSIQQWGGHVSNIINVQLSKLCSVAQN